ncbi:MULTISPECIES: hypothetical protein [unclassified Mesorhizobium]|uniref:DUF6894 family protein n=1 Tax=unclassified Mesorhizobium TaxID=325217 RepID=UPI0003D038A0|nr:MULTISPECIES: hypothetical protein [unclassified Mesorhizobium]ESZ25010.1 hypothetical protein X734_19985 [Mesorhizobium sp. L2C084A000]RUW87915.1 hypothetical protein EOA19_31890 [Mesorhizobium sp. M7A.F.Ca.US.010.02.1.1]
MARFYFDLTDNGEFYPDTKGTELPSVEAVEDEAARALLEIAKDAMPDGTHRQVAFHVRDDTNAALLVVKVTFELIRLGSDEMEQSGVPPD